MVQAAPEAHGSVTTEVADIPQVRGGGHAGHAIAFFMAAQVAPVVSCTLALALVAGGIGSTGAMWLVVLLCALPAFALFAIALFAAEHGVE